MNNQEFIQHSGIVRVGIEVGDHSVEHEDYLEYVKSHYDLNKLGFVLFHLKPKEIPEELFYEWARFFKEHDICFAFLYSQQRGTPKGQISHLNAKIVHNIKEIAGDYFIGDMIGETGGHASWPEGYFGSVEHKMPTQGYETMQKVKADYINHVSKLVEYDRGIGVDNVLAVEATAFSRYNFEAGVKYTFLETMCGNPQILLSFARGASRGYSRGLWGSHIAHEWYGGLRHDDPLKYKRLKVAYQYSYLAGANFIYSESGDYAIKGYGYNYDADHEYCMEYRRIWNEFADFAKKDIRPLHGPKVKVAFVHGNLDGFTGWGGTTVWNQYNREEWGFGAAENAWNILKDIQHSRGWYEPEVYGYDDTSYAPIYGMYDVIPIESPVEVMARYDYLIFAGWNTMTEEYYNNLKEYVKGGGHLLITAAHLNTSSKRSEETVFVNDGELEEFLGCNLRTGSIRVNRGAKFRKESIMPGVLYPAAGDLNCDPICAGGFANYADVELKQGRAAAFLCDTFQIETENSYVPCLIENRYGVGVVSLLTTLDYPGAHAVYPIYRAIVRELLAASHRKSDLKVLAGDKVVFSVYSDGDGKSRIYMLNTDYNVPMHAVVLYGDKRKEFIINPTEMKIFDFDR